MLRKFTLPFLKFGFGDKFIHMIEAVYTNIQSKTKMKGVLSDSSTLMWEGVHNKTDYLSYQNESDCKTIRSLYIAPRWTFQKAKPYLLGHIKKELVKQEKWYGHNFQLKYLEYILLILSLVSPIETK